MNNTKQSTDGPTGGDSLPLLVRPDFREQAKELVAGQTKLIEEILIRATVGILEGIYEKHKSPQRVGGDFHDGIEWMACWLLDNCEGEEIYEELLRGWAIAAWESHLSSNAKAQGCKPKGD